MRTTPVSLVTRSPIRRLSFRLLAAAAGALLTGALAPFLAAQVQKVEIVSPQATQRLFYDASNNVEYVCRASSSQAVFSWTRSGGTLVSIADSGSTATVTTSSAHGLDDALGARLVITGATVDADLNGTYVIRTTPTSTTFTITTSAVTDGTYTESTLAVSTSAPRTTAPIWAVQRLVYDAANNLLSVGWAGSPQNYSNVCSNRTNLEYR